jgi:peptidoglycan/LPS O-acetylase OafA/YrhL
MRASSSSRLLHLDALKAIAAQLIVLHHISVYGPVSESLQDQLPLLQSLLYDYGRMAVQVFLVVGGYLSARGLAPDGMALRGEVPTLLWRRYLRLVLPFMAAVLLSVGCAVAVEPWLPDLTPDAAGPAELLAHALLLHDLLGVEALTVGAWYVAIDMQLFVLLLGLLWLVRWQPAPRTLGLALVTAVLVASLFHFNRDPEQDVWAAYFFGAYGLGALVHLIGVHPTLRGRRSLAMLGLFALAALALVVDFRGRLALALCTAVVLGLWQLNQSTRTRREPLLENAVQPPSRLTQLLGHLGTHSYALFLVHFSVLLLVNALFASGEPQRSLAGFIAMLAAWALSNLAAILFYRWIELPASRVHVALPALLRRI